MYNLIAAHGWREVPCQHTAAALMHNHTSLILVAEAGFNAHLRELYATVYVTI